VALTLAVAVALAGSVMAAGCGGGRSGHRVAVASPGAAGPAYRLLLFSRTTAFRHDSIPAGIQAVRELGAANRFAVDATEDPAAFAAANLARYQVVMFLNTTGDVLDDGQQAAFESYIRAGGGFVGVHAAADTEYGWPFYGGMIGTYFAAHPAVQRATIRIEDNIHPATASLPALWTRVDEWYDFRIDPRPSVHVLATVDESTYTGGRTGGDHPIAWCHRYQGGRSFYTALGHTATGYAEPAMRTHLLGGIRWAAGRDGGASCAAGSSSPTRWKVNGTSGDVHHSLGNLRLPV
jgi:type 1 glutamine amidotransferase